MALGFWQGTDGTDGTDGDNHAGGSDRGTPRQDYDQVGEDDDGHLVVEHRARGGPLDNTQEEDGHYSNREENFKKVQLCLVNAMGCLKDALAAGWR